MSSTEETPGEQYVPIVRQQVDAALEGLDLEDADQMAAAMSVLVSVGAEAALNFGLHPTGFREFLDAVFSEYEKGFFQHWEPAGKDSSRLVTGVAGTGKTRSQLFSAEALAGATDQAASAAQRIPDDAKVHRMAYSSHKIEDRILEALGPLTDREDLTAAMMALIQTTAALGVNLGMTKTNFRNIMDGAVDYYAAGLGEKPVDPRTKTRRKKWRP